MLGYTDIFAGMCMLDCPFLKGAHVFVSSFIYLLCPKTNIVYSTIVKYKSHSSTLVPTLSEQLFPTTQKQISLFFILKSFSHLYPILFLISIFIVTFKFEPPEISSILHEYHNIFVWMSYTLFFSPTIIWGSWVLNL